MDITRMTRDELIALKKDITRELFHRVKTDYDALENTIIQLITDFEERTGHCVTVDVEDYTDRATSFIKGAFYYTDEYVEPYQ